MYLRRVERSGQVSDEVRVPYDERQGILLLLECRRPEGQLGLFLQNRASDHEYTSDLASWRCFCIAGDNGGIWTSRSISAPMTLPLPTFRSLWWVPKPINLHTKEIEAKGYIIHTTGYSAPDGSQPRCTLGFIPMGPFVDTQEEDATAWVIFRRPADNPLWPSFCLKVKTLDMSSLYGAQHFHIPEELFGGSLELRSIQDMTEDMILHQSWRMGTIILPLHGNVQLVVKMRYGSRSSDLKLSIEGHTE